MRVLYHRVPALVLEPLCTEPQMRRTLFLDSFFSLALRFAASFHLVAAGTARVVQLRSFGTSVLFNPLTVTQVLRFSGRIAVLSVLSTVCTWDSEQPWVADDPSTIHFSRISRCCCENCLVNTSFRTSRGNCFKRSRILINSLVCLDWGAWGVSDSGFSLASSSLCFWTFSLLWLRLRLACCRAATFLWSFLPPCLAIWLWLRQVSRLPCSWALVVLLACSWVRQGLKCLIDQMEGFLAATLVWMNLQRTSFEGQLDLLQCSTLVNLQDVVERLLGHQCQSLAVNKHLEKTLPCRCFKVSCLHR